MPRSCLSLLSPRRARKLVYGYLRIRHPSPAVGAGRHSRGPRGIGDSPMKIPHMPFFFFGMGNRRKLLYKGGALYDASTGELLRSWMVLHEQIIPHEYTVKWQSR